MELSTMGFEGTPTGGVGGVREEYSKNYEDELVCLD